MSRLMAGILILLTFLLLNIVITVVNTDTGTGTAPTGCTGANNFTTCQDVGKTSFLASLFQTTVSGVTDAPPVMNAIYLLVSATLLVTGILLVVLAFVPLTNS